MLQRTRMKIKLDDVPEPVNTPSWPSVKAWLLICVFLILVFLLARAQVKEPSNYLLLSWDALVYRLFAFVSVFVGRMLLFSFKWFWVDSWNLERAELIDQEINRGQKAIKCLAFEFDVPDAVFKEAFSDQLLACEMGLTAEIDSSTNQVIKRKYFARSSDDLSEDIRQLVFESNLGKQLIERSKAGHSTSVLFEFDDEKISEELDEAWQNLCMEYDLSIMPASINGQGLAALDDWLDIDRGSEYLLVIAIHYSDLKDDGHGDGLVAMLFTQGMPLSLLNESSRVCRPEEKKTNSHQKMLSNAVLWADQNFESLNGFWFCGFGADGQSAFLSTELLEFLPSITKNTVVDIDSKMGFMSVVGPWFSLVMALEQHKKNQKKQLVIHSPTQSTEEYWAVVVG